MGSVTLTRAPVVFIKNWALVVIQSSAGYPDNITPNFKGLFPQVLEEFECKFVLTLEYLQNRQILAYMQQWNTESSIESRSENFRKFKVVKVRKNW